MSDAKPLTMEQFDNLTLAEVAAHWPEVRATVEALECVTRERDEARAALTTAFARKVYGAGDKERAEKAEADAALLRIALENAEPIEAERDLLRAEVERLTRERDEARAQLSDEMRCASEDRVKARADAARLREALTTIERTGAPGATIVVRRSDGHSCSWCRGMVTPCPVIAAREALGEES